MICTGRGCRCGTAFATRKLLLAHYMERQCYKCKKCDMSFQSGRWRFWRYMRHVLRYNLQRPFKNLRQDNWPCTITIIIPQKRNHQNICARYAAAWRFFLLLKNLPDMNVNHITNATVVPHFSQNSSWCDTKEKTHVNFSSVTNVT